MAKSLESDFFVSSKFYAQNLFFLLATYLLSPLLFVFSNKEKKTKILVIQTAKIGDMVCTSPVFREIKKKFPDCYLTALVLSKTKGIIANNPHIDKIIILDKPEYNGFWGVVKLANILAKDKYTWSISLNPNLINNILPFWSLIPKRVSFTCEYAPKSSRLSLRFSNYRREYQRHKPRAFEQYLGLLDFLGIKNTDGEKEIFVSKEGREKADDFFLKNNLKKEDLMVGISVSSGNPIKDWDLDKFAGLADKMVDEFKAKIVFIGGPSEKELIKKTIGFMKNSAVDSLGEFSLEEIFALIERFRLFISVDTGPFYIANALGVPVINIAGPVDIEEQPRVDGKMEIVQKKFPCSPCSFVIPPAKICKTGDFKCTKSISADDVFKAVLKII